MTMRMASLGTLSMMRVRALQNQTGAQFSHVKYTKERTAIHSVFASTPHSDPASRLNSPSRATHDSIGVSVFDYMLLTFC